jgi:hypothetical protein
VGHCQPGLLSGQLEDPARPERSVRIRPLFQRHALFGQNVFQGAVMAVRGEALVARDRGLARGAQVDCDRRQGREVGYRRLRAPLSPGSTQPTRPGPLRGDNALYMASVATGGEVCEEGIGGKFPRNATPSAQEHQLRKPLGAETRPRPSAFGLDGDAKRRPGTGPRLAHLTPSGEFFVLRPSLPPRAEGSTKASRVNFEQFGGVAAGWSKT